MVKLLPENSAVINLLGKQKAPQEDCRPLTHLLRYEVDRGLLIYNCLTGALLLLEGAEREAFEQADIASAVGEYLLEYWYLVPASHGDNALSDQVNSLMRMMTMSYTNVPITHYAIFPTTDCNARCFYCFELACKRLTMTPQTASDVADFIETSCQGKPVGIRWFGGEPTYNVEAIDIICRRLREKGIAYRSTMVSNGYLFDDEMIARAKELWHLEHVKVALDGTESVYNRYKAYIYKEGNPFVRVTDNIGKLLAAGIKVAIRMNMDDHNVEDLYRLADQLYERFGQYQNLSFDLHLLFENSTKKQRNRSDDDRHALMMKFRDLQGYLNKKISPMKYDLASVRRWVQCMADDNASTTILPDGKLGKCDYYTDDHFYGSIYSKEIDRKEINLFREIRRLDGGEKCETCPIRPDCMQLVMCSDRVTRCDSFDQQLSLDAMKSCILSTYHEFFQNGGNEK